MKLSFLIAAFSLTIVCCNACSSFEDEVANEAGKAKNIEFCYKDAAGGRQISLHESRDCLKYDGGYVPYIGDDAVIRRYLIWWRGNGRRIAAGFAREKGQIELAKMIEEGGQPVLIAFGKEEIGRGVEVHFSVSGFNYIVLLSASDMSPLSLGVWQ